MAAAGLFIFGAAGMALARWASTDWCRTRSSRARTRSASGWRSAREASKSCGTFCGAGCASARSALVVGTVSALALTRLLGSVLYGVSATDPVSFAGALAVVLGGVVVATVIPAWRAARTPPLKALHQR